MSGVAAETAVLNTVLQFPRAQAQDQAILDRARLLAASAIADARGRAGALTGISRIGGRGQDAPQTTAGTARVVRTGSEDNLALHRALDLAEPGDVLVVEAPTDNTTAVMGDLLCRYALSRGVAAIVIDGMVRDAADLASAALPVYARGTGLTGPAKRGPGQVGGAVRVDGVAVHDGDLVVADPDGVVVVPAAEAASGVAGGEAVMRREIGIRAAIDAGTWDRDWVTAAARFIDVDRP